MFFRRKGKLIRTALLAAMILLLAAQSAFSGSDGVLKSCRAADLSEAGKKVFVRATETDPETGNAAFAEASETASGLSDFEQGILNYLCASSGTESVQAWLDSDGKVLFQKPAEWYFTALYQSGGYDFSGFAAQYQKRVPKKEDVLANSTWLNRTLVAWALGRDASDEEIRAHIVPGDIMSLVYGLHVSNNIGKSYVSPSELCSLQCADGGFSLSGAAGDVDVTAMVLSALAPHYDASADGPGSDEEQTAVRDSVARAVLFLSAAQLPNGGFQSYGADNCESASQVIIALCSLGIDPATDPRFQKNGENPITTLSRFRAANGAFCHKEGGTPADITSAETLCALTAYRRMVDQKMPLYILQRSSVYREDAGTPDGDQSGKNGEGDQNGNADSKRDSNPDGERSEDGGKKRTGIAPYKWIVSGVVLALFLISLLILKLRRRFSGKNVLLFTGIAAGLLLLTFFTNFETVSQHYTETERENAIGTVTITIRCDTIAGKKGAPSDPVILPLTEVEIADGDTAFAVLEATVKKHRIAMDYTGNGSSVYVKGIAGLYEFAYGNLSGWIYRVNEEVMAVGCGQAVVKPGDFIEFLYTENLGEDLK